MAGRETNIDQTDIWESYRDREKGLCVFVIFDRYDREMNGQSILIIPV